MAENRHSSDLLEAEDTFDYSFLHDQSTNDHFTNYHFTNDHSCDDQSSNDKSSSDEFKSEESSCYESGSDLSGNDENRDDDLDPSDLLEAACSGDVEKVTTLLDKYYVDKSAREGHHASRINTTLWRPLFQDERKLVAIQTLVSAGADINAVDKSRRTPLLYALKSRSYSLSIVRELIQLGADVNRHTQTGCTALMEAMGRDCLQLLIEAGADMNAQFCERTQLMFAVIRQDFNYLKLLLQAGADVNVEGKDGETALCMAVRTIIYKFRYSDAFECFKLLVKFGADVNVRNADGETALMHLAQLAKFSIDSKEKHSTRATECICILTDAGADTNVKTSDGETALMLAVKADITADRKNDLYFRGCINYPAITRCVKLFMDAKADVMSTNTAGQTALMYAVKDDNLVDLLPILVNAGAVTDYQDFNGMTALSHAVSNESLDCARWLVNHGASLNICDYSGRTHLAHAVSNGSHECVRWLINFGTSVNVCDNSGKTPLHYLMFANKCEGKAEQCLEVLLSNLPDVNARDNDGMTPLMYVAQKYQSYSSEPETLIKLLQHGADLNIVDNKGQTALIHSLRLTPYPDDVIEEDDYGVPEDDYKINTAFLLLNGADFSVGQLAEGQVARLGVIRTEMYFTKLSVKGLVKLRVGKDVDLEVPWDNFRSMFTESGRESLQFLVLNGVMPLSSTATYKRPMYDLYGTSTSVLEEAVKRGDLSIIKYLIATCYLRNADLPFTIDTSHFRFEYQKQAITMIENLRSQPWPLVKLCFVAVSTAFGASPGRQERVKNSQLPIKLQRMLLFQENTSRLCVENWHEIPLTLSPEDYEKLPQPRPLLYNWPVGRALVPCDCGDCDGTTYKYHQKKEDNENGGE